MINLNKIFYFITIHKVVYNPYNQTIYFLINTANLSEDVIDLTPQRFRFSGIYSLLLKSRYYTQLGNKYLSKILKNISTIKEPRLCAKTFRSSREYIIKKIIKHFFNS